MESGNKATKKRGKKENKTEKNQKNTGKKGGGKGKKGKVGEKMKSEEKREWEPGEEDALDHVEVLHEHVALGLGAEAAHGVSDAQLDGSLQS